MSLNFNGVSDSDPKTVEVCELQKFQDALAAWADATFGNNRPPIRSLHHLKKEVDELIAEPFDHMEYADAFLLLLDCARRAGLDAKALLAKAYEKLEINKKRKWSPPDENGVCYHIKEGEDICCCWLCKKPIPAGDIFYQGFWEKGTYTQKPAHKGCRIIPATPIS